MHAKFVPTSKTESILITAFDNEDREQLKQTIEQIMIENMEYYETTVESNNGKLLSQLKNETVLRSLIFDEETQNYLCKGYALKEHAILKYKKPIEVEEWEK